MILNIAPSVDFSLLLADSDQIEETKSSDEETKADLSDPITRFVYNRFKENG